MFLIFPFLLLPVCSYDCYDTRCYGGNNSTEYIECDQSSNFCNTTSTGSPVCLPGNPGNGTFCTDIMAVCVAYHGKAACIPGKPLQTVNSGVIWGSVCGVIAALLLFVLLSLLWRRRQRELNREDRLSVVMNIHFGESSGAGNVYSGESSGAGNVYSGESSGAGNIQSGESSGAGNIQSGESSGAGNIQSGESSGAGNIQSGESSGAGNIQSGESSGAGNIQSGESSGAGNIQSGESSGAGNIQSGESSGAGNDYSDDSSSNNYTNDIYVEQAESSPPETKSGRLENQEEENFTETVQTETEVVSRDVDDYGNDISSVEVANST